MWYGVSCAPQNPWPVKAEYVTASRALITIAILLPLTTMVLKHRNEGFLPAWLEARITAWLAWLRGRYPSNAASSLSQSR
jgi:hypothetical protein